MRNEKFPVFCPYCGAKMLLKNEIFNLQATNGNRARYWYRCRNEGCECDSPTRETAEEAYKAAVKRDEEPNKILSLYNICSKECFVEWHGEECDIEECLVAVEEVINREWKTEKKIKVDTKSGDVWDYPLDEYLRGFRFWLRKPTENEREAAKWLPEEKKNKKDGEDDE